MPCYLFCSLHLVSDFSHVGVMHAECELCVIISLQWVLCFLSTLVHNLSNSPPANLFVCAFLIIYSLCELLSLDALPPLHALFCQVQLLSPACCYL